MWGNAVSIAEHRPESYARNITLRYPVYAPFSGEALRFTFDNYCGSEPVNITCATVSKAGFDIIAGKPALECTQTDLISDITFQGDQSVTIASRQRVISDPVAFNVNAKDTLCVNLYFSDFTLMQSAVFISGPLSNGFFSFGDQTKNTSLPPDTTKTINWFYFLSNIDIMTSDDNRAVICYGDSITAQDWPDHLMLRATCGGYDHTSVIRRAASGTRILRQYDCITYDSYGLKGDNRISHEIPTSGADTVIIQQGINDIIHPVGTDINRFRPMSDLPTAKELCEGLKRYVDAVHSYGMKAYLGTLLPIYGWRTYAPFREELKNNVNDWMRSYSEADGCIDFDLALRDTKNPTAFRDGYDSGDHLHPSSLAYKAMADTVPDILLK
jgi:lysophospholipase L1-like esterase